MAHSGRLRPGSIRAVVAQSGNGTIRGADSAADRASDAGPEIYQHMSTARPRVSPEQFNPDQMGWLAIERIESAKHDRQTRSHVIHLLLGMLALMIVVGPVSLIACAYLGVPPDAVNSYLASVLAILASAITGVVGFLFGRGTAMTE